MVKARPWHTSFLSEALTAGGCTCCCGAPAGLPFKNEPNPLFPLIMHQVICPSGGAHRIPVQPFREKYSASVFRKYVLSSAHPVPSRGALRPNRHETWGGVRWTRAARLTSAVCFVDAKPCGSGAPLQASSSRGRESAARMTGSTKQVVPEESAE